MWPVVFSPIDVDTLPTMSFVSRVFSTSVGRQQMAVKEMQSNTHYL